MESSRSSVRHLGIIHLDGDTIKQCNAINEEAKRFIKIILASEIADEKYIQKFINVSAKNIRERVRTDEEKPILLGCVPDFQRLILIYKFIKTIGEFATKLNEIDCNDEDTIKQFDEHLQKFHQMYGRNAPAVASILIEKYGKTIFHQLKAEQEHHAVVERYQAERYQIARKEGCEEIKQDSLLLEIQKGDDIKRIIDNLTNMLKPSVEKPKSFLDRFGSNPFPVEKEKQKILEEVNRLAQSNKQNSEILNNIKNYLKIEQVKQKRRGNIELVNILLSVTKYELPKQVSDAIEIKLPIKRSIV